MPIALAPVAIPDFGPLGDQPEIPAATYSARADRLYAAAGTAWVVVYGDREHFGNILFLSGFEPRFEEALLLLGPKGRRVLLAGNECESYAVLAGLENLEVLLAQSLSLMGQDRSRHPRLATRLTDAGIARGDSIGIVGWKYLEPREAEDETRAYFVPHVVIAMLEAAIGPQGRIVDVTKSMMHPATGARSVVDLDQIARFEWVAARGSKALWKVLSEARPGDSEFEAAARYGNAGEPLNAHTMFASAPARQAVIGLRSPTARRLVTGDGVTTALGLWGALSSRAGLLSDGDDDFLAIARSYFAGLLSWYDAVRIGETGGTVYEKVTATLAEGGLRSALSPGHLGGHEEWSHSPMRPGSDDRLASGMVFQVDVIPTPVPIGQALNCEDAIVLADEALRAQIAEKYPAMHARIEARRSFVGKSLGVSLAPDILPLSSIPLCLPPFWLSHDRLLINA